jgi:hypothetical protein
MEIDYVQPLKLNCLFIEGDVHGRVIRIAAFTSYIKWEDIVGLEEFCKTHLVPDDTRPKTNVITRQNTYLVIMDHEEVVEWWAKYRIWANSMRNMIFSKN